MSQYFKQISMRQDEHNKKGFKKHEIINMEKKEMIERIKRMIEKYGECSRSKGCVETMAQTRKAMQKEDDFKYYEGQVKDREKNLDGRLDTIEKMLDIIAERK